MHNARKDFLKAKEKLVHFWRYLLTRVIKGHMLYIRYYNMYSSLCLQFCTSMHKTKSHYLVHVSPTMFVTRVPGEIKRSRDLRGGRWSWTLTFAQKRSWVGRWSWAEQVGRLLLRVVQVVRQQRCNGHCLSDSVQHSSWKSNCAVHKLLGNGERTPP